MIAVISADLLSSTGYSNELLEKVIMALNREFASIKRDYEDDPDFKIYRGDSFQGIIKDPAYALEIALRVKTAVNRQHTQNIESSKAFRKEAELRLAIGIGTYDFRRESISESNGQAFQFSGRTLDEMKNEPRKTMLKTPDQYINDEFNASLYLLDTIADKWSTASAEVIYYLLKDMKETEIAAELGISQSAVNQRKKAAGWDAIAVLLDRFNNLISEKYSDGK
ncbi:hypothetical protein [Christiangramia salexigens]|uniref:Fumarate hydratase n=1 Tax=Christiangramia salexigens TaxID=1913577 RepID=A0A1L3J3B5_9FLAO|nr:hypothetical protein [Christiangramia salexigens]APG59619.1 hypothetical protein LPB144_03975 [Christiangramia salexigens]